MSGLYVGDWNEGEFDFFDLSGLGSEIYAVAPIDLSAIDPEVLLDHPEERRADAVR